jgi:hypothetical protein
VSNVTAAPQPSSLRAFWQKWRFHLNVLLLLIPLGFMPEYFADEALTRGDNGLGEREIGDVQVGPWSLRLAEVHDAAPTPEGLAGYMKDFNAALCDACIGQVKATYLRIGKPRSLRTAGAIFAGSPYRMSTELPVPKKTTADAELWITMEGWDGTLHQASIPLRQATPATIAWLNSLGDKP